MKTLRILILAVTFTSLLFVAFACSKSDSEDVPNPESPDSTTVSGHQGFYLLSEGSWGSNNSTLDYYDAISNVYNLNWFSTQNPSLPYELGDVGNDMKRVGNELWIALNSSNLIEVCDFYTLAHITTIDVPQPRNIEVSDDYVFISSYANDGSVYKVSRSDYSYTYLKSIGYEPENLHIHNGLLYTICSGGYHYPDYSDVIAIIDLSSFTLKEQIHTGHVNGNRILCMDDFEYCSAVGDYYLDTGCVYRFDRSTFECIPIVNYGINNWALYNGVVYIQRSCYDEYWNVTDEFATIRNGVYQVEDFLDEVKCVSTYGLSINPYSGEFCITDADNYYSPGTVYYYNSNGELLWSEMTGVCPSKVCWID